MTVAPVRRATQLHPLTDASQLSFGMLKLIAQATGVNLQTSALPACLPLSIQHVGFTTETEPSDCPLRCVCARGGTAVKGLQSRLSHRLQTELFLTQNLTAVSWGRL